MDTKHSKHEQEIEKLQAEYDRLAKETSALAPDTTYGVPGTKEFLELKAKKKDAFAKLTEAKRALEQQERAAIHAPPAPATVPDRTVGKPQGAAPATLPR